MLVPRGRAGGGLSPVGKLGEVLGQLIGVGVWASRSSAPGRGSSGTRTEREGEEEDAETRSQAQRRTQPTFCIVRPVTRGKGLCLGDLPGSRVVCASNPLVCLVRPSDLPPIYWFALPALLICLQSTGLRCLLF